jgi:hypothetical protein
LDASLLLFSERQHREHLGNFQYFALILENERIHAFPLITDAGLHPLNLETKHMELNDKFFNSVSKYIPSVKPEFSSGLVNFLAAQHAKACLGKSEI